MVSHLDKIEERESDGFCLQVKHKALEVPKDIYLDNLNDYNDPFSEEAVQHLVEEYLDWKDEQGLIGMVRINEEADSVEIDAAVRYIVDCETDINN
ncbi:hypothetical protein JCM16358_23980 [Halanaerocella petrolearia]